MGRIHVLDEGVANQIAAGEVVERPSSVVKELLENALDAGASRIAVEIEGGGAERIRVTDDGSGLEREDVELAFERHATSKIREAADLRAIQTFGFRGEALPAIASVSRMTLTTATGGTEGGLCVRWDAGALIEVVPAAHPRGTTVEVMELFRNAPARRKFLKSRGTETAHIADLLARVAAAHPAIGFSLTSGGRRLADYHPVDGVRERIAQIIGPGDAGELREFTAVAATSRVSGLCSSPSLSRSTTRDEHLFVNGRPFRDRRLLHAVQEAYATLLPRGRFPVLFAFLEIPPDEVDVNVHPAKSEVRFMRAAALHDLLRHGLQEALGSRPAFYQLGGLPGTREGRPAREVSWAAREPFTAPEPPLAEAAAIPPPVTPPTGATPVAAGNAAGAVEPLLDAEHFTALAQFRDTYILAAAPDGLVIVDQHAAHERVLYERFLEQIGAGTVERQRLLFPEMLEVTASQGEAFEEGRGLLASAGFMLERFGPTTLRVDEVPAIVGASGVTGLVRETLDEVLEWRSADGVENLRHRLAARAACHAAVRANHPLAREEMNGILVDLLDSGRPTTCPHGRPAILRLPITFLEREFHRR